MSFEGDSESKDISVGYVHVLFTIVAMKKF